MIFYFSATGNSLMAAKIIAKNNGDAIVSVPQALKKGQNVFSVASHESVGFVFPVYYYGIPTVIIDFINELVLNGYKDNYTYLLLTCGSTTGNTPDRFKSLLGDKGIKLNASFAVSMPDNYIPIFKIAPQQEIQKKLCESKKNLDQISQKIGRKANGDFVSIKGFAPAVVSLFAYPFYKYRRNTKPFYAKDNCISCGKCVRECPAGAIELCDGKPVWVKKQCVLCLGCIHGCPKTAIEYGKSTVNKGRYSNRFNIDSL